MSSLHNIVRISIVHAPSFYGLVSRLPSHILTTPCHLFRILVVGITGSLQMQLAENQDDCYRLETLEYFRDADVRADAGQLRQLQEYVSTT
jgi:hypothetical protein